MRSRTSACRSSGSRRRSSAIARRKSAFCASGGRPRRPSCGRVIGSEQHRAISEQMAEFA